MIVTFIIRYNLTNLNGRITQLIIENSRSIKSIQIVIELLDPILASPIEIYSTRSILNWDNEINQSLNNLRTTVLFDFHVNFMTYAQSAISCNHRNKTVIERIKLTLYTWRLHVLMNFWKHTLKTRQD